MKSLKFMYAAALCGALMLNQLNAADVKTYQVTGPVLEITPTTIVVQKGKDRWELARDPSTKGASALKVGDKVTITYKMVAQDVETKEVKGKK